MQENSVGDEEEEDEEEEEEEGEGHSNLGEMPQPPVQYSQYGHHMQQQQDSSHVGYQHVSLRAPALLLAIIPDGQPILHPNERQRRQQSWCLNKK